MTEPSAITAHVAHTTVEADGLAAIMAALREKPALRAFVEPWLAQVQELESAAWALYGLAIDNSENAALDQVGEILALSRPSGMTDAVFRRVLRAAVIALRSSGTGDELLRACEALVGSDAFELLERFPAGLRFEPDAAMDVPAEIALAVLRRVKSGGVGLQVVDVPAGSTFAFATSIDEPEADTDRGWSDTSRLVGGVLVGVMR